MNFILINSNFEVSNNYYEEYHIIKNLKNYIFVFFKQKFYILNINFHFQ